MSSPEPRVDVLAKDALGRRGALHLGNDPRPVAHERAGEIERARVAATFDATLEVAQRGRSPATFEVLALHVDDLLQYVRCVG